MDWQIPYLESRVAFIGAPNRRLDPKLFSLYRLLLGAYGDTGRIDRKISNPDQVRYDEENRTYLFRESEETAWEDALRLTQRSVRLVLSEEVDEENASWFNLVLSRPEQEFPCRGGARLRICMKRSGEEEDTRLADILSGCREFARLNPQLPRLASVSKEREEAALVPESADSAGDAMNREAMQLVRELEEKDRQDRQEHLRRMQEDPLTIAVLDTEMAERRIIQFSGLLLQQKAPAKFAVIQTKNIYLQLPEKVHISGGVRNLTHISESMLAKKGLARQYAGEKEIAPFLEKADIICGHAVMNDVEALKGDFPGIMEKLQAGKSEGKGFLYIDTQKMADAVFNLQKTASLEECCELAKVAAEEGNFHDAMVDARMTAKLFLKLLSPYMRRLGRSPAESADAFVKPRGCIWLTPIKELSEGADGEE